MKQTRLWLTTIATLLCSLAASAHNFEVGGIYYNITSSTDLTVAVTYRGNSSYEYYNEYSGEVPIPTTVTYNSKTYNVTSIGYQAFQYCSSLTAITIPESVTSIGSYAFYGCSSLTSITIPESVTSIGSSAFRSCSSLTAITIPESVTSIGDYAFYDCESLTAINIPEGVMSIGGSAFYNCSGLVSIVVAKGNTVYDSRNGCNAIIETSSNTLIQGCSATIIPEGVTSIGSYAFRKCSSLTSITIPEGVTSIGSYAFYGCSSLTSITIPEGVTSIGEGAFYGCSSLTAINIPEGVTSIGSYAFYGCSSLTSITIPESVTSIGYRAFEDCSSLTSITIPEGVTSIGSYAFRSCSSLTSITIPESVTSIGDYAFQYCSSLTSITIPESVTSIGSNAFEDCSSLYKVINYSNLSLYKGSSSNGYVAYYAKVVYKGSDLTTVGDFQFYTSDGIHALVNYIGNDAEIVLPDSYNGENYKIGNSAFSGCSSLTSITIPESVTSIGYYAFEDCSSLTSVYISSIEAWCNIDFEFYRSNPLSYAKNLYLNGELVTELTIPNTVTAIKDLAFYGCSSLTAITIPEGVTSIGSSAFSGCSSLTSINIPEGVTSIGSSAFEDCSSLTSVYISSIEAWCNIDFEFYRSNPLSYAKNLYLNGELVTELTIPNTVTAIKDNAFYGCSSLTSITISEGVTSIGDETFSDCSSLTSITIPESVTSIGSSAFSGCSSLTSINIPEGVTSIGKYAFYGCSGELTVNCNIPSASSYENGAFYRSNFTKVTIGESVTSIGSYAFDDCRSLTSINIPEGVTSIGSSAFSGCSSLTSITIPEGVTSIGKYAFYGCSGELTVNCNIPSASSYENGAFYRSNFTKVTIGESVTSIGIAAFYGCRSLTSITIPEGVTSIGIYAFDGCSSLYSVTIGSGVLSIGSNAFSTPEKVIWLTNTPPTGYANAKGSINYVANDQYTNLSNVQVYPYLSSMFEVDGVKYVPVSPSERTCHAIDCAYDSTATAINVGETVSFKGVAMKVTEVMPYTFYGNDHIEEVSVSHLGNIGDYAFYDCDSIETVDLSNQGYIGSQAFYDCDGIKSVDISNRGSIGNQAFYGCYGMETANVTNKGAVGNEAFSRCSSLKTVTLGDSIGSLGDKAFYQCRSLQEIAIPDSVKSVGAYCFSGCSAMKSAVTGNGLTNIKEYTFESCAALVDVMVGDGVTTISNYAFTGCSALTNVALGRKVATINNYAFQNCSSLPEITLPLTMTKVGDYVFSGCSKLADVVIADRTTALALGSNGSSPLFVDCPLDSVYIGGKITYSTSSSKGYSPFYRNTSLRTVVITDREEQIYDNEFYGCTNLKSVTIGNGVKSIGDYAFSGCSSLDGFSFGSNMESIGAEAFSDCTNLTTITSHAAVPPTCGTQALDDINKWSCTLRVPQNYATAYQAADQWKAFFFVEDVVEVEKYVLTYVVDGEVYHTDTLVHKATIVLPEAPTKEGYTFSGWSEAPETMPAEDVTISGTFTINKYLVTFKVGDEVIAADSLEYGATIVVPEAPEREGHTFNGWGEVAETVPAGDVTYEGSYTVNIYKVYYYVGEELVHTAEVAYGEKIPEYIYEPTKEGDVLEGWTGEPYDTMPAHDVTYTANITNGIEQLTNAKGQLTIYDLNGRKIEVEDLRELLRGIYIVNGHRVLLGD